MLVTFCVLTMLSLLEAYPVKNKTREMSLSDVSLVHNYNDLSDFKFEKSVPIYKDWNKFMNKSKALKVVYYEYLL